MMEKKIEDYLHLYFGCDVWIPPREEGAKADIFRITGRLLQYPIPTGTKIYLRPLSDMTEREQLDLKLLSDYGGDLSTNEQAGRYAGAVTHYLLNKHFDLFNLIPEGLAIDKSAIDNPKPKSK